MMASLTASPLYMVGIVAAAVAVLIVMVMKYKLNAFIALMIVSILSAFMAGISPVKSISPRRLWRKWIRRPPERIARPLPWCF